MLDLIEHDNHLEIVPDTDCLPGLADCRDLSEALERWLCNGWSWIDPCEIGALTDGGLLTQEDTRDDNSKLAGLGVVYWDSEYQVRDTLAELQAGRAVRWVRAD